MLWLNQEAKITNLIKFLVITVAVATTLWPGFSFADHVPDNLPQDLNPNYIACLMAVEDASTEFRDELQSTCLKRMVNLCIGKTGVAPPSQVIDCLHFETQRATAFLTAAMPDLPDSIQGSSFARRSYKKIRTGVLNDMSVFKSSPKPKTITHALEDSAKTAGAVTSMFWLARKTGTPLQHHVEATFSGH